MQLTARPRRMRRSPRNSPTRACSKRRPGKPQYRIAETPSGILNSIGLENPGAVEVARRYGKAWAELGVPVIVNVAGYSVEDYVYVVHEMTGTPGVVAYELNVSCPNVKGGMLFGCDPDLAADVTRAVKAETDLPVIVKLTPNAPDVVAVARACEEAGADGLTAINTVLGMRIDTKRPSANRMKGSDHLALDLPGIGERTGQAVARGVDETLHMTERLRSGRSLRWSSFAGQ